MLSFLSVVSLNCCFCCCLSDDSLLCGDLDSYVTVKKRELYEMSSMSNIFQNGKHVFLLTALLRTGVLMLFSGVLGLSALLSFLSVVSLDCCFCCCLSCRALPELSRSVVHVAMELSTTCTVTAPVLLEVSSNALYFWCCCWFFDAFVCYCRHLCHLVCCTS
jgi:hypothetical protein